MTGLESTTTENKCAHLGSIEHQKKQMDQIEWDKNMHKFITDGIEFDSIGTRLYSKSV